MTRARALPGTLDRRRPRPAHPLVDASRIDDGRSPLAREEDERLAALRRLALLGPESRLALERVARLAQRLFSVRWAFVSLCDEDRRWPRAQVGLATVGMAGGERRPGRRRAAAGDVLVVPDARRDEGLADDLLLSPDGPVAFYARAPIRSPDGQVLGAFCVIDDEPRVFSAEDVRALEELAALVEREMSVQELACTDEVTGVYNRRGFLTVGRYAIGRAEQSGTELTVAYLDVDGLKLVNDAHGHGVGDHALLAVAQALRASTRASDVVGRLGGDEFGLLLFDCNLALYEPILAALERRFADELSSVAPDLELGLSAGAADARPGLTLEELITLADTRMYERKLYKQRQQR